MTTRRKVAVLISGRGSNMQALVEATRDPGYPAQIVVVISNVADAGGLDFARGAGIATEIVPHRGLDRAAHGAALDAAIRKHGADLVCLAGFMRLLDPGFVEAWRDRLINVHPSLLPSFRGLDTHAKALAAGVKIAGCTVHFVRADVDAGPIIAQAAVPVLDGDTEAELAARILAQEHRIYPLALRLVAEGRVRVEGDRTIIGVPDVTGSLANPSTP